MKVFVYGIAVFAAIGLAIGIASYPQAETQLGEESTVIGGIDDSVATTLISSDGGTVNVAVPEMHCQFSCFPRVKSTLEKSPSVDMVELPEDVDFGDVDGRFVVVHYKPGFNADMALAALEDEGFVDSKFKE